jgi:hypothetical protein
MIPESFVDEFVPDWQMPDEGRHAVSTDVGIVYTPQISRPVFDKACGQLEKRHNAYRAQLQKNRKPGQNLYAIDSETVAVAREAVNRSTEAAYLDQFMFDTEKAATFELGGVITRAKRNGVSVTPANAYEAVSVIPGRSFASTDAKLTHERGGKIKWTPTVRLHVQINFEGKRDAVEIAVNDLRSAMLFCGPVTSFRETSVRPTRQTMQGSVPTVVAV